MLFLNKAYSKKLKCYIVKMSKNVIPLYPLKVFNFIHLKKTHLTEIPKTFHHFLTIKGTYNFFSFLTVKVLQKRAVILENMRKK